ncbi:hypothetical protein [Fulvivirga lutimaris]|uniref:hypothetical protein n=1 Tax=Fulvivirga lutimaris TaxID=1819566 RepID=UPI001FE64CDE|nr:hypothetical protein [Fulvivirga lutimaris]
MKYLNVLLLALLVGFASCDDDDVPAAENEEEVIDNIVLTFTDDDTGDEFVFEANDPSGSGSFTYDDIEIKANATYTLSVEFNNAAEGESITEEIEEEADEHMIFFEFTNNIFANPQGNGNIGAGSRDDALNYLDQDGNGQPTGLSTSWQTGDAVAGVFRIVLKHQPDNKSATSTSTDGETDVDVEFPIAIIR